MRSERPGKAPWRAPRVRVSLPTAVLLALAVIFKPLRELLVPISAAMIHELGHIVVIMLCGADVGSIELSLFGAEIGALTGRLNKTRRIFVYAAGALANLVSGAVAAMFGSELFCACSLALAIVNLLPVRTLDGGCIAEELLGSFRYGGTALELLTGILVFALWLASVIALLFTGNISLWMLSVYLFVTLYLGGR